MGKFSELFGEVLRQEGLPELKLQWLGSNNKTWSSEEEVAEEVAEEDPKHHLGGKLPNFSLTRCCGRFIDVELSFSIDVFA